ncbi:hypothetical protein QQF64_017614 [Cirrhinus molitorella]|uniref:Acidic fibroblast growth factor intracellular-binding protein n=1 Tax=Cirrhinus molitorella TaxID=172907 RepID=A0ABR3LJ52_9TELE
MSVELDVFVGNTTVLDEDVYQLWLDGHSVTDAVTIRVEAGALQECEANAEVLHSDTMDQFRTFQMCEQLLQSPSKLANQLLFQIPPHRQTMLIERYYEFDSAFAREVLGKKLSKGTKKDLDDISSKTGIALKSCRRQFDNFKRVFKVVEELKGPLVENIQRHFLLSDVLARDYAAIVFFANSRFETGKRKLQYLSFQDFAFCAGQLISYWTVGAVDNMMEDMDVDLEKEFLHDLKDLKVLVNDKDMLDQHKSLVCAQLRGKIKVFSEMEASFKNLSRALVNIASKLTHTKDVRDLFIDLVEKFIEPCRSDKWTIGDLRLFLTHYSSSVHTLEAFRHQVIWDRYMGVIKSCILKIGCGSCVLSQSSNKTKRETEEQDNFCQTLQKVSPPLVCLPPPYFLEETTGTEQTPVARLFSHLLGLLTTAIHLFIHPAVCVAE